MTKRTSKVVFAGLLIIFLFLVENVIRQATVFNTHRDYFKQPLEKQTIQEWMTFSLIERYYHINPVLVLHTTLTFSDLRNPISNYCAKEKLDCNKLVTDLENYKDLQSTKNND